LPFSAAVITALPVESVAVLSRLSDLEQRQHQQGTIYSLGRLDTNPAISVAHVEIGMGVERTAQHVERAVDFLRPDLLLFVGIAGGVKDCSIGDVVVATKTYQYDYGVDGVTFRPRPQTASPSHLMEQIARVTSRDFAGPVTLGAIATGGKVVHSKASGTGRLLNESYSDTIAVDMEGHGLYVAASSMAGLHSLVIRGVSDLLDGKAETDAEGSQGVASKAAADFAVAILEKFYDLYHSGGPSVAVNRLPTDLVQVVGRDDMLTRLTAAWHDRTTRVLSLTAWAGTGKTALARAFCEQLVPLMPIDSFVFTWSFYQQGTDGTRASADEFFVTLLEFLGCTDAQRLSPWRRVELALELCCSRSGVLVLDGIEPLQYPDGIELGRLADKLLAAFVDGFSCAESRSKLFVTSRVPLVGVTGFHIEHTLTNLSSDAAADALEFFGLKEQREALLDLGAAVDGHCLSLRLIAHFLLLCDPRLPVSDTTSTLAILGQPVGKVRRILRWYEEYLAATPQCDVLRSLGLFDRPAPFGALQAVHTGPMIEGINPVTHRLDDRELELAVRELAKLGLVRIESVKGVLTIDLHPLLRESFARELESDSYSSWVAAHARLRHYFSDSITGAAQTGADLNILYRAVKHGCLATNPKT
jgi:nucleoside phosphorylase